MVARALHCSRPALSPLGALSRRGRARDEVDAPDGAHHLTVVADEGDSALFPIWEDLDALGGTAWAQPIEASGLHGTAELDHSSETMWATDIDWAGAGELLLYEDARAVLVANRGATRLPGRQGKPAPTAVQAPEAVRSVTACPPPERLPPSRTAIARARLLDTTSPERNLPVGPPASAQVHLNSNISPYFPPRTLSSRGSVAAHPDPQPHHFPLVSRYDWRLSSPLAAPCPSGFLRMPPLLHTTEPSSHRKTGVNRLVGIGLDSAREGARWQGSKDERWGWKVRVPQNETTVWTSADAYRSR